MQDPDTQTLANTVALNSETLRLLTILAGNLASRALAYDDFNGKADALRADIAKLGEALEGQAAQQEALRALFDLPA